MIGGPSLPPIEPPKPVPPPPAPLPPPARGSAGVQGVAQNVRDLFRRRGRQTTLLTPGGGAGDVGMITPTRKTLLGQ
jgi:hypothetical protein